MDCHRGDFLRGLGESANSVNIEVRLFCQLVMFILRLSDDVSFFLGGAITGSLRKFLITAVDDLLKLVHIPSGEGFLKDRLDLRVALCSTLGKLKLESFDIGCGGMFSDTSEDS